MSSPHAPPRRHPWPLLLFLAATACGGGGGGGGSGPDDPTLTTVDVSPSTSNLFTLAPGNSVTLTVVAKDEDGQVIAGAGAPTFTSLNTAVATVAANGLVTAVGAGTAQVSATMTHDGVTKAGNATVTVVVAPGTATVTAPQFVWQPATVDVSAGGQVTWSIGAVHHTITFTTPGSPTNIPELENDSDSRVFPAAGSYQYVCSLHAGMNGLVRVH